MEVVRPRLVVAAVHSGSGKTTIASGIAAALAARGLRVHPFKVGPDYIDPGYLGLAAGSRADSLDTWLTGEETMKKIFLSASEGADVSIIEGVMGLYDGGAGGVSSTAQIAKLLRAPVLLVIDVRSMGESAAAIAAGFRDYDRRVALRGVIINRFGSENHRKMVCDAVRRAGLPVLGALPRNKDAEVRERHLGLLPVEENDDGRYIETVRKMTESSVDLDALLQIARSAPPFGELPAPALRAEKKAKIAVACDEAFSFYYPESVSALEAAGAEIINFSPLNDEKIPDCGGLIFGGGFPEVFAARLAANGPMKESVVAAASSGMPIYAECGGFMYLTREITDLDGVPHKMAGVIPMRCRMNDSLRTVGYVTAKALFDNVVAAAGERLRGHEFHFSSAEEEGEIPHAFEFTKNRGGETYSTGYAKGNVLGSYLHLHFAGFPKAALRFVEKCAEYEKRVLRRRLPPE
ncbi:cobyrinate a,c-diamide synthase [Synergistes jonesii]|uniref:cobyrinate a,c-diamide synthase n=1 Tax=Synergistes jonesii TaxID=2754 RepID=UPI0024308A47|nr:cobyrinate a,c-diamide synthase [Synergistes jonesii]